MPQVELVKDPERYFRLLTCQSTQVKNIQFVNDEGIEFYYTHREGFVSGSAFTTAHARLKQGFCILTQILLSLQVNPMFGFQPLMAISVS